MRRPSSSAAMVIGSGSASFRMLRSLVDRLPVMIGPRWIDTRSQPVAVRDVVALLAKLATHPDPPREVQLGGADVLTYREMMNRYATIAGRIHRLSHLFLAEAPARGRSNFLRTN